jgi:hypothetical protein
MLFKLLGAPITLPLAGMKFVLDQIAELANRELNDAGALRDQLLLLQVQLEEGDISEGEFAEREAELLARMRELEERQRAEGNAEAHVPVEANVEARRRLIVETPFDE